eukprot:6523473-Lingulodinium_polyedra.AAC.1
MAGVPAASWRGAAVLARRTVVFRGATLILQAPGRLIVGLADQGWGLVVCVAARVDVGSIRGVILRLVNVHRSRVRW